jgi:hypothetical protein
MSKKLNKLNKRQLAAQERMDEALSEIISAANLYSAAEKEFYARKLKSSGRILLGVSDERKESN